MNQYMVVEVGSARDLAETLNLLAVQGYRIVQTVQGYAWQQGSADWSERSAMIILEHQPICVPAESIAASLDDIVFLTPQGLEAIQAAKNPS